MSASEFRANPEYTRARVARLEDYFASNVLRAGAFICPTAGQCRASHSGRFYEGQLLHVGKHYDLTRDGKPVRVAVVGQEYGHTPALVGLEVRHKMVLDRGLCYRFKAEPGHEPRNPHMKGCTSLLRLIFGLGLGSDHDDEFLTLNGGRVHVFDCFALVNFLLCSAIPADAAEPEIIRGGKPGRSTRVMRQNCATHFRAALDILEPTIVVAQGHGVRRWIGRAYGLPARRRNVHVEELPLSHGGATLLTFSHPSAHGRLNWGVNERTEYLMTVVAPTVAHACPL